jgi:hypothetical protein
MDPYASRPSIEQLLAGTPLEAAIHQPDPGPTSGRDLLGEVRNQLALYVPYHTDVWHDVAAAGMGVRSDYVALVAAQRLRIQVRHDAARPADLAGIDPAAAAGPIYGAFPDTAGVIVVCPDGELSSVAIDPFDTELLIETPAGAQVPPRLRRAVLPLADTVRSYLDDLAPSLDASVDPAALAVADVDTAQIARSAADRAVEAVAAAGRRARIVPKQVTWSALGQRERDAISELVVDALGGLDHRALASRIAALGEAA